MREGIVNGGFHKTATACSGGTGVPGWEEYGGGRSAGGALVVQEGLELGLGELLVHNWFLTPSRVAQISFDYTILGTGISGESTLEVAVEHLSLGSILGQIPLTGVTQTRMGRIALPSEYQGGVVRVGFSVLGTDPGAEVRIDNVQMGLAAEIFEDGFESGDFSAWTGVSP